VFHKSKIKRSIGERREKISLQQFAWVSKSTNLKRTPTPKMMIKFNRKYASSLKKSQVRPQIWFSVPIAKGISTKMQLIGTYPCARVSSTGPNHHLPKNKCFKSNKSVEANMDRPRKKLLNYLMVWEIKPSIWGLLMQRIQFLQETLKK
jgi:hypothetical protein